MSEAPQTPLLVIIPAFNEHESLPAVFADLRAHVPGAHVVVIDDGSTDNTSEVARSCGAAVLTLPYNLGIGGALRTGFRYAVRHGYQRAVQFDADGQHRADQIQRLLDQLDAGADLVIGSRFLTPDTDTTADKAEGAAQRYTVGAARGLAMGLLRWVVSVDLGKKMTDTSSGFRGFSAKVLASFADDYPVEYMESVEALLMAHHKGFAIVETGVTMDERSAGQASNRNVRLAYHFFRLLLVVAVTHRGKKDEAASTPSATSEAPAL